MIKHKAYWIDYSGNIIPVGLKHINLISEHPKKFGLTKDYIESVYKKHKERPGQEGNAREEIMVNLMNNGWIRLRHHPKTEWMVQLDKLTNRNKNYLFDFALKITDGTIDKMSPYTGIVIMDHKGKILGKGDLQSVLNFKLFECSTDVKLNYVLIEDYEFNGGYLSFGEFLKENK